jgi:hypothetical protein
MYLYQYKRFRKMEESGQAKYQVEMKSGRREKQRKTGKGE